MNEVGGRGFNVNDQWGGRNLAEGERLGLAVGTFENSKRKRKRVKSMTGEVLTYENVLERLTAEESDRNNKFHQVNIQKDVKDTESFKVKQGSWVERFSTGQEVNHLNLLDK
ncbi:hypothetical protein TNCV_3769991 [Trichonephila clavipes]|nr:hypothetical protein TNCV_3769991 [Trichonephila clavipes]